MGAKGAGKRKKKNRARPPPNQGYEGRRLRPGIAG